MVLDLIPDDSKSIFRKRTITMWDKKRKNYVKVAPGTNPNNRKVKLRTESGQLVSVTEQGKIYEAWTKKNKETNWKSRRRRSRYESCHVPK